ncbi:hypothetical protein DC3_31280 [Deinococcus cellulosilyticus NBRC 106333 = KACC 11606]|uniref:Uncharacterized protein n=1 Tax=Deinococcus cellulosilyticus (strain DSM 18568 / NBRC 106333 / KACC 11606 / 5516J-15) TaxID=1223518 RepID=A0A511N3P7_DEIC1|nr:hypothetical protein DC3_31280 [Deinococcus cellulosilyticus NBRC 106333 = KACC 11606]
MLSCVGFANCLYDPEEGYDPVPLKAKNDIVSIVNERAFMIDSKGKSTRLFEPLNRNFKDGKLTSASRNFWTERAVKQDGKFEFKMIRMNQREVYI